MGRLVADRCIVAVAVAAACLGCEREVIPASGRVFIRARAAEGASFTPGTDYTDASLTVVGFEDQAERDPVGNGGFEGLEWSVEGGRYGNTTERVVIVALHNGSKVVTAKSVSFILPWSGAKRLDVLLPPACEAIVPGSTSDCDVSKLTAEWVDVTTLPEWTKP